MSDHALDELVVRDNGFDYATCMCGWESPPCPGPEEAANFWGQHLLIRAVVEKQET